MNRLYLDLKESHNGQLTGTIKLPADGCFTLEALAEVVTQFCKTNGVEPREFLTDLLSVVKGKVKC